MRIKRQVLKIKMERKKPKLSETALSHKLAPFLQTTVFHSMQPRTVSWEVESRRKEEKRPPERKK